MTLQRRTPLKPGKPLATGGPIARKTGMTRKAPPARDTRLQRDQVRLSPDADTAPMVAVRRQSSPRRDTGPSQAVRRLVVDRDHGRCVRCGEPATNIQHRRNRGMGGRKSAAASAAVNAPGSLIAMCGTGTTGCHGWVHAHPAEAVRLGYQVSTNATTDPADIPVYTYAGWRLYDNDGGHRACPSPGVAA